MRNAVIGLVGWIAAVATSGCSSCSRENTSEPPVEQGTAAATNLAGDAGRLTIPSGAKFTPLPGASRMREVRGK